MSAIDHWINTAPKDQIEEVFRAVRFVIKGTGGTANTKISDFQMTALFAKDYSFMHWFYENFADLSFTNVVKQIRNPSLETLEMLIELLRQSRGGTVEEITQLSILVALRRIEQSLKVLSEKI